MFFWNTVYLIWYFILTVGKVLKVSLMVQAVEFNLHVQSFVRKFLYQHSMNACNPILYNLLYMSILLIITIRTIFVWIAYCPAKCCRLVTIVVLPAPWQYIVSVLTEVNIRAHYADKYTAVHYSFHAWSPPLSPSNAAAKFSSASSLSCVSASPSPTQKSGVYAACDKIALLCSTLMWWVSQYVVVFTEQSVVWLAVGMQTRRFMTRPCRRSKTLLESKASSIAAWN